MIKRIAALWRERRTCWLLVKRDLRVRYSRSFLGYLWSLIEPLANAMVYFLIFGIVYSTSGIEPGHQPYILFLLLGLLPWQWFNSSVSDSTRALLQEWKLVKSTNLPREIWVVRMVLAQGIEFLLSMPVLTAFWLVFALMGHASLNANLVWFPVAMLIQFFLQVGIGLALAPITVLVNDIQPLVRIFLRVFFYLCPVILQLKVLESPRVPGWIRTIFVYNPFSGILELYRAGFFPVAINWTSVGAAVMGTLLALLVGGSIFARLERAVLKEI